ncbi:High cysteine membrane protein EGF-like [Giardia duodenalis]|uniref:High cysteine membrane protein EGF-like n=1 Tax=Giardia intestinalis (strain ATCC 50803 / WB clone C6) TaxID=184922 RepID=A0A644F7H1_GIAIC|nr:High cysteine membrane protein EGF-like [Giardia intestinalis]KAE8304611.1 High cysteine membrane protein EGF-like [Giardia intestinalis]
MLILLCAAACLAEACGTGPACVNGDCAYGDGAHFCQCRRGWVGAACDAPRAGFRKITTSGQTPADRAVNYACLVNGTECTGSSKCTYYAGAYSCDPCPAGFVSYEGECLPRGCFNTGDYSDQEATKAPCNGRGRCLLKDPGLAGMDADDYACDCYPIYRGGLCQSCDDANAIAAGSSSSDALPTCNARACQDSDGVVCSGQGTCTLDVGLDRESYHYRCKCNDGYTRVGHKCVRTECVATIDGSPVVCGGFGECTDKDSPGTFKCVCDSNAVPVGQFCTYPACTDSAATEICGGVGACVRDGAGYKCDCRGLATGDLCDTCTPGKSAQVGDKCVPVGCLTSNNQESCKNGGTCVKSDGEYHCRCPDMLIAVSGECTSPACMDEELGKVCSGHGTCKTDDPQDIKCTCSSEYTYVAPGRCILTALMDGDRICSGHGHVSIDTSDPPTMTCRCSSIYEGSKCETCKASVAQEIEGECVPTKCIVAPQPGSRATTPRVCDDHGQYTKFGDPSDPFATCTPKDPDSGTVSAYNGTFLARPGCVHVSKVDRTRRFYCGFLQGLTDNLQEGVVTCNTQNEGSVSVETCNGCPEGFKLVHFGAEEGYRKTCMHDNCYHGTGASRMWYDYCGGTGDCIKEGDTYRCDCGPSATWNEGLKACVTEACKLNKTLAGPEAPEYCAAPSSLALHCTVGRDAAWQCDCPQGDYLTYNRTCILRSKSASPTTHRARGLCGGPGAGFLSGSGSCVCNPGFLKIDDMCYSYDCLPVGVTADTKRLDLSPHVCSGKGVCAYNQLTGRYGCECEAGLEAFGGYCTHPGCAGKVIHNGELKYVECKVYDGSVGSCVQSADGAAYFCACSFPYTSVGGLCVHQRCVVNGEYCGGDALASCVRGSDSLYGCVCSEGYELSEERSEHGNKAKCVPSRCMYRPSAGDPAIECNGLGTCGNGGGGSLLKDKRCECSGGAQLHTLRDASGELRETCILDACISSKDQEVPVICGGSGRCGPSGCICNLGTKLFGNACVGINCFINATNDSGGVAESVCGSEAVGVCTKIASHGDRRDYACKCVTSPPEGYEEVDGFCLPKSCVFAVGTLDGQDAKTMCGGSHFGTCVISTNQQTSSYCSCKSRPDVVQLTSGQCMKRDCVSDALPGSAYQSIECYGHGKCRTGDGVTYACKCEEGYKTVRGVIGTYLCIPQACVVSETDTAAVCSGRGTCSVDEKTCKCGTEYAGERCETCAAGYKEHTNRRCYRSSCPEDGNCGVEDGASLGSCQFGGSSFSCICVNSSFVTDSATGTCRRSRCVWVDPYDHAEKTCYGMGWCSYSGATEQCSCNPNTVPVGASVCVYAACMPSGSTDDPSMICRGRGTCVEGPVAGTGLCRCDSSRYRTDKKTGQCFVKECFGAHESILAEVCDGGGTCSEDTKKCNCNSSGFQSLDGQNGCVHSSCVSSDNKLCSGFGACEKTGDTYGCLCASYYTLVDKDCIPTRCLKDGKVCNGGGTCSGEGSSATCSCSQGWTPHGTLCYPSACVSGGALCGGNGDCQLSDGGSCSCRSGYETVSGGLCVSSQCVQRGTDGTVTICGGNGRCVSENGVTPSCVCNEGFSLTSDFVCGVPAPSKKSSAGTTAAIVVVVLLVLVAVAGFLVWWFVIRPRRGGPLRERVPQKGSKSSSSSRSKLRRQADSSVSLHADVPLLSQASNVNSSIQL